MTANPIFWSLWSRSCSCRMTRPSTRRTRSTVRFAPDSGRSPARSISINTAAPRNGAPAASIQTPPELTLRVLPKPKLRSPVWQAHQKRQLEWMGKRSRSRTGASAARMLGSDGLGKGTLTVEKSRSVPPLGAMNRTARSSSSHVGIGIGFFRNEERVIGTYFLLYCGN